MMDEGKQDFLVICIHRGECSAEFPCSDGSWCNMEYGGVSGRCISCRDQKTKTDCFANMGRTAGKQQCYDVCVSPCEREQEAAVDKDANGMAISGVFSPTCEDNGDYSKEQCWASTGFCWCSK